MQAAALLRTACLCRRPASHAVRCRHKELIFKSSSTCTKRRPHAPLCALRASRRPPPLPQCQSDVAISQSTLPALCSQTHSNSPAPRMLRAAVRPALLTRLATPVAVRTIVSSAMGSSAVSYPRPVVFQPTSPGPASSSLIMIHGLGISADGHAMAHAMAPMNACRRRRRPPPLAARRRSPARRQRRGVGRHCSDAGPRPAAHAVCAAHRAGAAHHAQRRCGRPAVLHR